MTKFGAAVLSAALLVLYSVWLICAYQDSPEAQAAILAAKKAAGGAV